MTPQEREEFELVAKACGIEASWDAEVGLFLIPVSYKGGINHEYWNPKTDDGDALRLAVKLGIAINHYQEDSVPFCIATVPYEQEFVQDYCKDPLDATRRDIWRAAVEYARSLK